MSLLRAMMGQGAGGPPPTAGLPPNTYAGLTFWFDADNSPIYVGATAPLSVTTSDGARPTRIDSAGSIARSLGSTSSEIATFKNPIVGAARGLQVAASDQFITFGNRPTGANQVSTINTIGTYWSASNKAFIVAIKVDDAPADSGVSYNNVQVFGDAYNGYCALTFYKSGSNVVFEAYNWGGSEQKVAATAVPLGTWVVVTMKHAGGQLRIKINGGSWNSIASGSTSSTSLNATWADTFAGSRAFSVGDFCMYSANRADSELLEVARYVGSKVGLSF